jgi:DNA-binding HxlR family transcriptional regulator
MPETEDVERAVDELFTAPPEGFTQARDALTKRLKDQGDAGSARRVGALRKPVRSAWAVNRLAHEDRPAVEELLQVGEQLRLAQRRALSGGDAEELRRRADERRKLVTELTRRAARDLGEDPTPAVIEEVAATLEAASADEDAARQVLEGRLSKPFARPAGFGDVASLKVIPGASEPEQPSPPAEDRAERASREREIRAAERRERQMRERAERIRAEVTAMEERLAERKEKLGAAEAEARGAAVELKRLRG